MEEQGKKMKDLIIFGAQGYALGVYEAMKVLQPRRVIPFFMVSSLAGNPTELAGVPVREIAEVVREFECVSENASEGCASPDDVEIIIATPENVMPEIEKTLEEYGFHDHSRLTADRWDEMMKQYHMKLGRFTPLCVLPVDKKDSDGGSTLQEDEKPVDDEKPRIDIYMAKFYKDKDLANPPVIPEYVHPLQVGAANTDVRVAELTDMDARPSGTESADGMEKSDETYHGQNISHKNGNYCELTGLYWIWKNRLCTCSEESKRNETAGDESYIGLCQYRRMFMFSDDDLKRLITNDIDVVLPYPLPYEPDINEHHKRYLKDVDWEALLTALEELQPEYADYFSKAVLQQKYLFNYNVILAKRSVLRDYCEWMFPILERTEELSVPKGSERSDRYIGYMAETLETLYFMKNSDSLNIAHTTCRMWV